MPRFDHDKHFFYLLITEGNSIPYTREHNDRSFYLKLVAAMGRYIYGVYLFMG